MATDNNSEWISCFAGQIFMICVTDDERNGCSVIEVNRHKLNAQNGSFIPLSDPISFNIAHSPLRISVCKQVLEKQTGLYKLYAVFESKSSNARNLFIYDIAGVKLSAQFDILGQSSNLVSLAATTIFKLMLFDGPGVCFYTSNNVLWVLYDGNIRTHPINNGTDFMPLECQSRDEFLLVIGTIRLKKDSQSRSLLTLCISLNDASSLIECVDSYQPLPGFYTSLLGCIRVKDLIRIPQNPESSGIQFHGRTLACTSYSQLLECRNGHQMSFSLQLPFNDGCDIYEMESFNGRLFIIIVSLDGTACVVDRHTSEIISTLEDVDSILVDDFVGCGSEQVLFISKKKRNIISMIDDDDWMEIESSRFLLTDFSGIEFNRCMLPLKKVLTTNLKFESNLTSGHQAAIEALKSRLDAGYAMVDETRKTCNRKLMVIEETCEAVKQMMLCNSVQFKSVLFPLTEPTNQNRRIETREVDLVVTSDIWRRILMKKFIVGVTVRNNSDRLIHSVLLSLHLLRDDDDDDELTTISRCIKCLPSFQENLPEKRMKTTTTDRYVYRSTFVDVSFLKPFESVDVVAFCQLPLFLKSSHQTFHVTLNWKRPKNRENEMEKFSISIGSVSISTDDLMNTFFGNTSCHLKCVMFILVSFIFIKTMLFILFVLSFMKCVLML